SSGERCRAWRSTSAKRPTAIRARSARGSTRLRAARTSRARRSPSPSRGATSPSETPRPALRCSTASWPCSGACFIRAAEDCGGEPASYELPGLSHARAPAGARDFFRGGSISAPVSTLSKYEKRQEAIRALRRLLGASPSNGVGARQQVHRELAHHGHTLGALLARDARVVLAKGHVEHP